jgi:Helix-turn-helix domain, rpiR family
MLCAFSVGCAYAVCKIVMGVLDGQETWELMKLKMNKKIRAVKTVVPSHYEGAINLITANYEKLSDGYKQVARFFTQNPNVIALESINAIAAKTKVHPSTLVRFAQNMGYSGFKELQAVFQTRLATAAPGFRERVSVLDAEISRNAAHGNVGFLRNMVVRDIASLQGLLESVSEQDLQKAAELCASATCIYVAGQLRSEPIADLIRYLMTMLQRKVIFMDSSGVPGNRNDDGKRRYLGSHRIPPLRQGSGGDCRTGREGGCASLGHYGQSVVAFGQGRRRTVYHP